MNRPRERRQLLFVLDHFFPFVGGAEVLFLQLCRGLVRQGHRVTVVTTRQRGLPARDVVEGIEIVRVWAPAWGGRCAFMLLAIPYLLRLAAGCDLIHTATYAAALPAWICGVIHRKPTVLTVYEVLAEQWSTLTGLHPLFAWSCRCFERLVLSLPFSQVICISRFTQKRFLRVAGRSTRRCRVIYPALDYKLWDPQRHRARDLRRQLRVGDGCRVSLFFGRPGASKGVETLVDAFRIVIAEDRANHLVLLLAREPTAGYRQVLRQITDAGLTDSVTVLDPVPRGQLPGYLLAADCVAVPSRSEGFGYSVVEAATLGCAVVATSGHAVEEVAGDHVRLVPAANAHALAEAMLAAVADKAVRRPLPPKFNTALQLEQTLETYDAADGSLGNLKPSTTQAAARLELTR